MDDTKTREQAEELKTKITELQDKLTNIEQKDAKKLEEILDTSPLRSIYSWQAPDRIYKEKSKLWYVLASLITIIGVVVAALLSEYLMVLAILAVGILVYVSNTIKPQTLTHEITNKGVRSGNQIYTWPSIKGFWLAKRSRQMQFIFDLKKDVSPNRVIMLVGGADPQKLFDLMVKNVPYLTKKDIGEDMINIFTLGEYLPMTTWMISSEVMPAKDKEHPEYI
jgi:hypothetical protein